MTNCKNTSMYLTITMICQKLSRNQKKHSTTRIEAKLQIKSKAWQPNV